MDTNYSFRTKNQAVDQTREMQQRRDLANRARNIRQNLARPAVSEQDKRSLQDRFSDVIGLQPSQQRNPSGLVPGDLQQWKPLFNRHAPAPLILAFGQWGIRSIQESYVRAMENCMPGGAFASEVLKFSFASFIAEATRIVNDPLLNQWQQTTFQELLKGAERTTVADPRIWSIQSHRQSRATALSAQGLKDTSEATRFVYGVVSNSSAVLTALWQLTTAGATISASSMIGPALSFGALYCHQRFMQEKLSEKEHKAEKNLRSIENQLTDNLQIGNSYNKDLWEEKLQQARKEHCKAWRERAWCQAGIETALTFLNTATIIRGQHQLILDTDFSPSTPDGEKTRRNFIHAVRETNMFSHRMTELVKDASHFQIHSNQLENLNKSIHSIPREEWGNRAVQMLSRSQEITITGPGNVNASGTELINDPFTFLGRPGRWTIRAENGVGKSVLMTILAHKTGTQGYFLPVKHDLSFRSQQGSAGETVIEHIAEIIRNVEQNIIFLDEWPANLSRNNEERLSQILDEHAESRCIVEIRH